MNQGYEDEDIGSAETVSVRHRPSLFFEAALEKIDDQPNGLANTTMFQDYPARDYNPPVSWEEDDVIHCRSFSNMPQDETLEFNIYYSV